MTTELAIRIPGFPNYKIGMTTHRVWNRRTRQVLKQQVHARGGYFFVRIPDVSGELKNVTIHRALGEILYGPLQPSQVIRHYNDVPTDNRLCNLRIGTRKDNAADRMRNRNGGENLCPAGHEYTADNTYLSHRKGRTARLCRTCHRHHQNEYLKRKKAGN